MAKMTSTTFALVPSVFSGERKVESFLFFISVVLIVFDKRCRIYMRIQGKESHNAEL